MRPRRHLGVFLILFWALGIANGKNHDEFVVIVNRSNQFDGLSRSKISFLYLRKVSRWPSGAEAYPIDLVSAQSLRREFTGSVLGISDEQLQSYWIDQRETRGVKPPIEVRDAAAAKALVASHPGAIAYIPASELDDTVKVLKVEP